METFIKAILLVAVVAAGWLSVQLAWRRVFAGTSGCEDPQLERCCGCLHGCWQSMRHEPTFQQTTSTLDSNHQR